MKYALELSKKHTTFRIELEITRRFHKPNLLPVNDLYYSAVCTDS